jgi:hypothetical protein
MYVSEGLAWYVNFPRGYWLYEKSKHLWVSGYPIKSKLFKSPQEFALHLIWLLSSSADYKDCCCVHCNLPSMTKLASAVDDGLTITPKDSPVKADRTTAPRPTKLTPVPIPAVPAAAVSPIAPPKAQIKAEAPGSVKQEETTPAAQSAAPVPAPQAPSSKQSVAPDAKLIHWGLKGSFLFRVGELMWYQNGNTWRLGVIVGQNNTGHDLLPISYGLVRQQIVTKVDAELRPFYAFSVPPASIPELKGKAFDEIHWDAMFQGAHDDSPKRDMLALDASKLAASKIDISFSLWGAGPEDTVNKVVHYYGGFLGAERVEIGDTLRVRSLPPDLKINVDRAVIGVYDIWARSEYPGAVLFRGNVYYLASTTDSTANFVPDEYLPLALRDETHWRQQATPGNLPPVRWALVREDVVLEEGAIKGRFYPTQRLMPLLKPTGWQQPALQGQISHLNTRMEGGGGRYIGRRASRLDTLGASVAHGARIALEPHVTE